MHGEHHFHVQARLEAGFRVVYAVDEIAHDEAVKAPLVPEDVGEQLLRSAAVVAIELVVGAHDGLGPSVDALFEVRQIDLVQRAVVAFGVDEEAQILDGVEGVVLGAGDHALLLHGPGQRGAVFAQQEGVLAVGLLGSSPARIAHQVDAHAREVVGVLGDGLVRDGLAEAVLQLRIEGGRPQHGHREAGGIAHHNAPGPVGEGHGRYTQTLAAAGLQRAHVVIAPGFDHVHLGLADGVAGEHVDFLVQGHLATQSLDLLFQVLFGWV